MTRTEQATALLLRVLRDPEIMPALVPAEWDRVLPLARSSKLLAHLGFHAERAGVFDRILDAAAIHMDAARVAARHRQQLVLWELDRVERALRGTGVPLIVLKGAAYLIAELPFAAGRTFADLDVMTLKDALVFAEEQLLASGWQGADLDAYDQRYYREWTHELPPMRHPGRLIEVDLHHTIAPPTSRVRLDPLLLFDDALPIEGHPYRVLNPPDMVLHSAVHLFHDSDLDNRLRDLVDLGELLRHFDRQPQFWDKLAARSDQLGLGRPMFYAARYTQRFLGVPTPRSFVERIEQCGPPAPIIALMDSLIERVLLPQHHYARRRATGIGRWLLYTRSHWLRMPPPMLARHLFHKAFISRKAGSEPRVDPKE